MITRFAPSPTGPLHLGHAYSAILAHDMADAAGGTFLLRIEDIDRSRARPEWEDADLRGPGWLGLSWEAPVMRQSGRMGGLCRRARPALGHGPALSLRLHPPRHRRGALGPAGRRRTHASARTARSIPAPAARPRAPSRHPSPATARCASTWPRPGCHRIGLPLRVFRNRRRARRGRPGRSRHAPEEAPEVSATSFSPAATWAPPTTSPSWSTTPRRASPMSPAARTSSRPRDPRHPATPARPADAHLPPPPPDPRRSGQAAGQARRRPRHPHLPRRRRQPRDIRRLVGL
jgi:hypothetical protein